MMRLKGETLIFIASTLKYNPDFKTEIVQYDFAVIKANYDYDHPC